MKAKKSRIITDQEYVETLKGINKVINRILLFVGIVFFILMVIGLVYGG